MAMPPKRKTKTVLESAFFSDTQRKQWQADFDLSAVFILILDRSGRVCLLNQAGQKLLGYRQAEIIGRNWFDLCILKQEAPAVRQTFRKIMSGQLKFARHFENSVVTKSKKTRVISWYNVPLLDRRKKIQAVVSSGIDITEQREAEQALTKLGQKYQSLFENLADPALVLDLRGKIIEVNQAAIEQSGFSRQELENQYFLKNSSLAATSLPAIVKNYTRLIQGRESPPFEAEMSTKNRQRRFYRITARRLDQEGQASKILVLMHDVTEVSVFNKSRQAKQAEQIEHQKVLLEIERLSFARGWPAAVARILELVAQTLNIERVGLWLYRQNQGELYCEDQFRLSRRKHERNMRLRANDYPRYFKALRSSRVIAAAEAQRDPRTSEFTATYLRPNNIYSMLDVPIRAGNQVIGILCNENVGQPRYWSLEEQSFLAAAADQLALRWQWEKQAQAQEKIAQSEQELQSLVRAIPDPVFVLDRSLRFVGYYAPDGENLFVSPEKFLGRTVAQVFPAWLEKIIIPAVKAVLKKGGCQKVNYQMPLGPETRYFETTVCARHNQRGRVIGAIAVARDVTAERRAVAKITASEIRYRSLFEKSQDGIFLVNAADGRIREVNPSFEKMTGFPASAMVGRRVDELPWCPTPELAKKVRLSLQNSGFIQAEDLYLINKAGQRVDVELRGTLYRTAESAFVQANVRDITERKELDRAKSDFISLASHQLRTPLTALNWYGEMLSESTENFTVEQKQNLQEIINGSRRMVGLINSLLDVSRLELQVLAVNPKPLRLNLLTDEIVKEFEPQLSDKALVFKKEYDQALPAVMMDPDIYHHILQNFLSNAIKYTPARGKVTVRLKQDRDQVVVEVADTGFGISARDQKNVCNKLWRSDQAVKADPTGQGLGLYIVKKIMDHTRGKFWFTSREKHGSTFAVAWPLSGLPKKPGKPLATGPLA